MTVNNQDQNTQINTAGTMETLTVLSPNAAPAQTTSNTQWGAAGSLPATGNLPVASTEDLLKLPDVRSLVENARSQEKAKLYKSLESKEGEIRQLKEEIDSMKAQLTAKENDSLSEMTVLQNEIKATKDKFEALIVSIESEREAEREKRRKAELDAYKERRLREVGDELVLALVGGNSEEAIDASIEMATQEYQNITARALEKAKASSPSPAPKVTNTPKVTNPQGVSGTPLSGKDVRSMSNEDYAKHRDRIREALRKGQLTD